MADALLSAALREEVEGQANLTATFKLGSVEAKVGSRPLTPADMNYVNKKLPTSFQLDPTQFDGQVDLLIRKCRPVDDEGVMDVSTKVFSVSDRAILMRLGVEKISEMFTNLFGEQVSIDEDDEEAVKNS